LPVNEDKRGVFVEMVKTSNSGQISYFTLHPGMTRGNHYHHSKIEKFLILQGKARFSFKHILTNEIFELIISAEESRVVETIPGWTHNVKNIGTDLMIAILWVNYAFDINNPDTFAAKVES